LSVFFSFSVTKQAKYLYWFFGFLTFGILTKSIAALLFIPGLILYALHAGIFKYTLQKKQFYLAMLAMLLVSVGYY